MPGDRAHCEGAGGAPVQAPWPRSAGWSDGGNRHGLQPVACGGPSPPT